MTRPSKTPSPQRRKRQPAKPGARARPQVLKRFSAAKLAELELRVSRDISDQELRELSAGADAAYIRVRQIEQLLRDLKALRQARGLTQAEVDRRSGIGRANVSRLENLHLDNPSLDTILRYAQAVGAELCIAVNPKQAKNPRAA